MSYFLVGEAPNQAMVGRPQLWLLPDRTGLRHTANRLLELTRWSLDQYLRIFEHRTNLWPLPNRLWLIDGRAHAAAIMRQAAGAEADGVVLLGARVAECFGLFAWPRFEWCGRFTRPVAVIPHPSGRCRFWNDPGSRPRAVQFFDTLRAQCSKQSSSPSF